MGGWCVVESVREVGVRVDGVVGSKALKMTVIN